MVGEGDEQVLHLRVSQATILGATARLEQDAAGLVNIGFWTSIEDAVLFTVTAPRAGRYDVALCYACPAEEAGSQVVLESEEGAALTIAVQATGGFDRYVRHLAPRPLRLPAGESRLRLRPLTLARRALMNLRWLELWPHRPLLPSMEEPSIAVAALRGAQRVVVAGQVVRAGRRPRLRVAGLRVATSASEGLAASAAERAEADARLDEWTGGGALEDELLRAALAVLGLGDEAEESVALRARDEQGAPVTRLAQAARLLLLQALGAADALAADPALAGSPRSHVVLLGAVPSLLPALAGALSLSEAALAPRASVLRGRVQLDDEAGYTATPGGLARLDAGTWVLPLDQAPWRGPAVRECLQEVLEGVVHTPASGALLAPLPVRVRCAVLLHGAPSALLALSGGARAVAAQRAAALALAFTCTLHLDRGSRSGSAVVDQDPDALSAPQRAPLVVDAAAQRGLRLVLARLCDRAAQVDLSEVADEEFILRYSSQIDLARIERTGAKLWLLDLLAGGASGMRGDLDAATTAEDPDEDTPTGESPVKLVQTAVQGFSVACAAAREAAGITLAAHARRSGFTPGQAEHLFTATTPPALTSLAKLAAGLNKRLVITLTSEDP